VLPSRRPWDGGFEFCSSFKGWPCPSCAGEFPAPRCGPWRSTNVRNDFVLVPDLNGQLVILDQKNKVVSVVEVGRLLSAQGFLHPHDAIWLVNGDIVVCTWNPGRLGYWRRLPAR
jgi:hypothetical protein